jgi:hypothetical protein
VAALSDADIHKSHGRHIPIAKCREIGLKVTALEDDLELQDLVLTIHHCYMFVTMNYAASKIVENHLGSTFAKQQVQVQMPFPMPPQQPPHSF